MKKNKFVKKVCHLINAMWEDTTNEFSKKDPVYKELSEIEEKTEMEYMKLCTALTQEQVKIIRNYFKASSALQDKYASIAYIAGMSDMIHLLGHMDCLKL